MQVLPKGAKAMFSKEEIALAKDSVKAIKFLAGKMEGECPECKGGGILGFPSCLLCNGTGKVKGTWEWEPRFGDFFLWDNDVCILGKKHRSLDTDDPCFHVMKDDEVGTLTDRFQSSLVSSDYIPLLHWERIRKILKQVGYSFLITSGASGGKITVYKDIGHYKMYEKYHNNDLQCAVMRAVIKLRMDRG